MDASNWGKYANNICTLTLTCENPQPHTIQAGDTYSSELIFRDVAIPNIQNFPHKKRCMLMVKDLSIIAECDQGGGGQDWSNENLYDGPYVSVEMDGLAVQNSYNNKHNQSNTVACGSLKIANVIDDETVYGNFFLESGCVNPLTDGVLCSSPFGKNISIRVMDMFTNSPVEIVQQHISDTLKMFLTLKILFVDDHDMKQV